ATLRLLRDRAEASVQGNRATVLVATTNERSHWVLGAIPAPLAPTIVTNADSVTAVQVLLQLCPMEPVEIPGPELLDVNTPELRPDR
ncbi:MAG: hypothetical protein ACKOA5_14270, partial [Actinomycetota bacterium]